jgi:cellulose synthase/poly-beta-1,6-N-acetylglucosamine synthase-like glycosyltransferase
MEVALLVLVLGVNLTLWTLIGGIRLTTERLTTERLTTERLTAERLTGRPDRPSAAGPTLSPADVAVLIPAHNEEPVIAATIDSVLRLVPAQNVHVVADGCTDATAAVARACGVEVLELTPGRGKAGGIEAAITQFDLPDRFAVLLIADADTRLDAHYLRYGLPALDQPGVIALAGYARAGWRPQELSLVGRYLISYRTRLYAVMQWLKYGQTWRWTNVTAIVPGFASMYRTSVLSAMDLNPPGLVIEDFNMTFEIHHKRLGKIGFRPAAHATTQDPDNFRDYCRQVLRWHLGFWQTVRRHGLWRSWFCAALVLFLAEVLTASVGIVLLVGVLVVVGVAALVSQVEPAGAWLAGLVDPVGDFLTLTNLLLFLALPDYLLTCLTALVFRRPSLLLYGVGFLGLRFVDATVALLAIPMAWRIRSNGQWTSPARRPITPAAPVSGPPGRAGQDAAPDPPRLREPGNPS